MKQKKVHLLALLLLFAGGVFALSGAEFPLVKNGKCQVVLVKDPLILPVQKLFAEELKKCGVILPIAEKNKTGNGNKILFRIEKKPVTQDDFFTIDFPDKNTMRITASTLSARWAVTHLLERCFGVRYLFPHLTEFGEGDVNEYPKAVNVSCPMKKFEAKPYSFFLHRTIDWRRRSFMEHYGSKSYLKGSHFIPVDIFPVWKYAPDQSWPREILPILRGKKYIPPKPRKLPLSKNPYIAKKGYDVFWNPCFSNPATTRIAIENVMEILKKNPGKQINMGLNDNGGMCECANCKKIVGGKRNSGGYADWSYLYWKWVNDIANAVAPHHPDSWFVASSYRESMDPPPFKLHKQVAVRICFEIYGMTNAQTAAKRYALMENWAKSCENLVLYDYSYGNGYFLLPRITFRQQSEVLKEFYRNYHVRGVSQEAAVTTPFEGPKHFLMFQLMRNIHADPEKIVQDWCKAAVGEKAAGPLREYYAFWEKYWMGEDIRKTLWYRSSRNIYLQLGERSTHTFALKQGDMAYCRSLLEKVVALAGTPSEKRRARILLQFFELSEYAVKALFSEIITPEGKILSSKDAVKLIRQVPEALKALDILAKHPFRKYVAQNLKGNMFSNMGTVMPYIKEAAVRRELEKLAAMPGMDPLLKSQIRIWLGAEAGNMVPNSSFEKESPLPPVWGGARQGSRRNTQYALSGKYSFGKKAHISMEYHMPIACGKIYMLIFSAFTPRGSAEGRLNYMLSPGLGGRAMTHIQYLNITLPGGQWQSYMGSFTVPTNRKMDSVRINIWTDKFEKDELILIDDVQFYCLDDLRN